MIRTRRLNPNRGARRGPVTVPEAALLAGLPRSPNVVVLVDDVRRGTVRALGYGAELRPRRLSGLHVIVDARAAARLENKWERHVPGVMLDVIPSEGRSVAEALRPVVEVEAAMDGPIVVVVPERRNGMLGTVGGGQSLQILAALHDVPNTWVVILAA